jgi:hypothetical protein
LKCRISHTGQPQEDEAVFDYGLVSAYSIIELLVFKTEGKETENSSIIGSLFIRVLDIINYRGGNHTHQQDLADGASFSTTIDSWFEIAPAGKVYLTIKFGRVLLNNPSDSQQPILLTYFIPTQSRLPEPKCRSPTYHG